MTFLLQLIAVSVVVLLVALGIHLVDRVRDNGWHRSTPRRTRRTRRPRPPMWERPSRLA